jgi:serine protease Do
MMRKKKIFITAVLLTLFGLITGTILSSNFQFPVNSYASESMISKEAIEMLSRTNQAITEVAATVKPSVVNIASTKTLKHSGSMSPFFQDPFFKRFFGDKFGFSEKPKKYKQSGLGSGVIVRKEGFILTNNHVIKGADEIKVTLHDKREFKGKVIGTDQKTDLAVIKVEADDLPEIRLGDSDELKVGETVLAIGNPFGLNATVTSGIVSAKGRANVGIADYEDFIQTDAPINPGNSGGALVNIRGELIGINTAIFSTTGGYQGIGFAIPSNMARVVMENLIETGKVVRGWLGVTIQTLTPELAEQFNLHDTKGVLVGDVSDGGPAEKAGIQRGDVIVEYDGEKVDDVTALRNMVANTPPDGKVAIKLIRDGKTKSVNVRISEMASDISSLSEHFDNQLKGVSVQDITPQLKNTLHIPKRIAGVVVSDVQEDSPAAGVLKRGDVIMEINKEPIQNLEDYQESVSAIETDEDILMLVFRGSSPFYVTLSAQ